MKTAIVILNWNGIEFLKRFLPGLVKSVSLENGTSADDEVIIADNASEDGSMEWLAENYPGLRTIRFDRNYGFTGGYNRALAQIDAQYYLLINSDIEVTDGWLAPLEEYIDTHPLCGACAPKLHSWKQRDMFEYAGAAGGYLDKYGYPFCRGRVLDWTEKDFGQYDEPENVLWASGACLMVRAELFNRIGGFDERFFAHQEEIDLCWRMHLAGGRVVVVPQSTVYHLGGGSLPAANPRKTYLNFRNNLLLMYKNMPAREGRKLLIVRRLYDTLAFFMFVAKFQWGNAAAVLRAHRDYRKMKRNYTAFPAVNLIGKAVGSDCNIITDYYLHHRRTF